MHCAWLTARIGADEHLISILEDINKNHNIGWDESHAEIVQMSCLYHSFFVTEKGYLGLGPGLTEVEDQVCVLFGSKKLFILRKASDHFRLIRESYNYGIMNGEVVHQWEADQLSEQWFEIP